MYVGFKTLFYIVRHLDSTASYLPTGLHLGFFRSWPSLYLPSSFSSVFLVLSFVTASNSMLFGYLPSAILWTWPYHVSWFCSVSFIIGSSNPICCLIVTFLILSFLDILEDHSLTQLQIEICGHVGGLWRTTHVSHIIWVQVATSVP